MFRKKQKSTCDRCQGHGYTAWIVWKCPYCGYATQGEVASFANGPVSFLKCRCGNRLNIHQQASHISEAETCGTCDGTGLS